MVTAGLRRLCTLSSPIQGNFSQGLEVEMSDAASSQRGVGPGVMLKKSH